MTTTQMMPHVYEVDGIAVDILALPKHMLEILFKNCGLRGDTARILKGDLLDRIRSCEERTIIDGIGQMIDDGEIIMGETKKCHQPVRNPITSTIKKDGCAEVDISINGVAFRLTVLIKQIGG